MREEYEIRSRLVALEMRHKRLQDGVLRQLSLIHLLLVLVAIFALWRTW